VPESESRVYDTSLSVSLTPSWNITPLCGSTSARHIVEALEAEQAFGAGEPEVAQLWDAMRRAKRTRRG
jgi:hypothetical protein